MSIRSQTVAEGGLFINSAVFPVKVADLEEIEAHVMHNGRTYYEIYNEQILHNQWQ